MINIVINWLHKESVLSRSFLNSNEGRNKFGKVFRQNKRVEDEDYPLTCYWTLSPEMKKMIRVMANYALIIDRDRKEK